MNYYAILIFFFCLAITAGALVIAWDPSPSPNITGYKLYYGLQNPDKVIDIGNFRSGRVDNALLSPHTTYTFWVSAYQNGVESRLSNPIRVRTPLKPEELRLSIQEESNRLVVSFNAVQSYLYDLQSTEDLLQWNAWLTNFTGNGEMKFYEDPQSTKFFRLGAH
jgi:hypothetical protein